jgi:nucleotide-binding universal stress UspA family protein
LKTYKNILVGFDDTEYSRAALIEAAHWVKGHGGKVTLVHAVYFDTEEFSISPGQLDKRIEVGKKACYQAQEQYSSELGIDIESLVCEGEPHEVIVDIARDRGADLIAMGTYGRKGLKRMIMGSVTSGVILNSPCDVLVVKHPRNEHTGKYASILVPFDGSESSKKALLRAIELPEADDTSITLLYVIPYYEEMIGFFKTASIQERLFDEARKVISEGEMMAYRKGTSVSTIVEEGHTADKIVEIANGLRSDLIVMGSRGWRGVDKAIMGSTTERVIAYSSVPVLVVSG